METADKEDRDKGTKEYSSVKELLFAYMEKDSESVWTAKSRAELDVCLELIGALLNLDSGNEHEDWIPSSKGQFLLMEMDCLQQCRHNNFRVVAAGKISGFFIIVTEKEDSSLCTCLKSHKFAA